MLDVNVLIGFGAGGSGGRWEYVGVGADGTGVDPTVPLVSGIQAGDLLIIQASGDGTAMTAPGGWTTALASSVNPKHLVCYKIAGVSESAPSCGGGHATTVAVMHCYRNVSGIDVTGTETTANSSTATAASITTTQGNALVISFFACRSNSSRTWTPPSGVGLTTRYQKNSSNGVNVGLVMVDENKVDAGATTERTAAIGGGTSNNSGIQVAFKPE